MALTEVAAGSNTINAGKALTIVGADETNGNKVPYSRNTVIVINETGGANSITPSIASNTNAEGKSKTTTATIAADGTGFFGPFDEDFNKGGFIEITFTGTGTGNIFPVQFTPV